MAEAGEQSFSKLYSPYGEPEESRAVAGTDTRLGFQGDYTDKATGLVDMGVRLYDPTLARFISRDTEFGDLKNPTSLNQFAYANGNPVTMHDPTGMAATWAEYWAQVAAVRAYWEARRAYEIALSDWQVAWNTYLNFLRTANPAAYPSRAAFMRAAESLHPGPRPKCNCPKPDVMHPTIPPPPGEDEAGSRGHARHVPDPAYGTMIPVASSHEALKFVLNRLTNCTFGGWSKNCRGYDYAKDLVEKGVPHFICKDYNTGVVAECFLVHTNEFKVSWLESLVRPPTRDVGGVTVGHTIQLNLDSPREYYGDSMSAYSQTGRAVSLRCTFEHEAHHVWEEEAGLGQGYGEDDAEETGPAYDAGNRCRARYGLPP
jgi:RHS repeat-associated protein